MFREHWVVFREFLCSFKATGELCPTSKWAASELTRPLKSSRPPKAILEVGAGTGSITKILLREMVPGDSLTLCELNPSFVRELQKRLEKNPYYQIHKSNIRFFQGPVQALPESTKYDVLVCSLPFLNFEVALVKDIFAKLHRITTEQSVMTYYEFIGLRWLGKRFSWPSRKRRLSELEDFFRNECLPRQTAAKQVWLNFLPISVFTLDMS